MAGATRGQQTLAAGGSYCAQTRARHSNSLMNTPITSTIQKPFSAMDRQVGRHPLDSIFVPKSVAVVGATEKVGSVGRTVLWNLMNTPFGGPIYPVNPTRPSVLGIKAYPKLAGLPEKPDLVVVTTPAAIIPGIIGEAADLGIPGAVVISAGFKETGPAGAELERQVLAHARRGNMRLVGPNCLGVMNPISGVNATFAAGIARRGNVAFISQSGALCTAVLDWSLREMVGFSAFVSIGSMLDVGLGRPHQLLRRRSQHQEHRHLHGDHR